jgi:cell division protein FtsL
MRKKKNRATEFHTVKRLDNTRLVRHMEPVKMRNLYRTVALSSIIAAFFLLYIYQHFKCIDLSFQLEAARIQRVEAAALNSSLKLEIAGLSNPRRIDMIARRQLGLTETLPSQVREYQSTTGAELASAQFVRVNRAQ